MQPATPNQPPPPDDGGGAWRLIRRIHRRRPLLTAAFVLAVLLLARRDPALPVSLLRPRLDPLFVIPWLLTLFGVAVRVWGAGNLRKKREITRSGVYRMVRHPLYLGSLSVFLAFFLTVGNPVAGVILFAAMVVLVYYPTMLDEEAHIARLFPEQTAGYARTPRLVPALHRLPEALRTDRFTWRAAYQNLGLRSLWILLLLPLLLEWLRWAETRL
jgi:protein-S-isoprenylcysteine O-methyltransferase Ste14